MNSESGEVFADLEATRGRPALDIVFLSDEPIVQAAFINYLFVPAVGVVDHVSTCRAIL
jgi:hypothetical protein